MCSAGPGDPVPGALLWLGGGQGSVGWAHTQQVVARLCERGQNQGKEPSQLPAYGNVRHGAVHKELWTKELGVNVSSFPPSASVDTCPAGP